MSDDQNREDEYVDYDEMAAKFGFNKNSPGHAGVIMKDPLKAVMAYRLANEVEDIINREYKDRSDRGDNEIDAFRHALWSYKMAKYLGEETAREMGDAHEVHGISDDKSGSRLMDLHNNEIGRQLAKSAANRGQKDEWVVHKALKYGFLRTKPYKVKGDKNRPESIFGNRAGMTATGNIYQGRK